MWPMQNITPNIFTAGVSLIVMSWNRTQKPKSSLRVKVLGNWHQDYRPYTRPATQKDTAFFCFKTDFSWLAIILIGIGI